MYKIYKMKFSISSPKVTCMASFTFSPLGYLLENQPSFPDFLYLLAFNMCKFLFFSCSICTKY